jgi:hypothetical protein
MISTQNPVPFLYTMADIVRKNPGKQSYSHKPQEARCGWLTPIILATEETELRRTTVQSQPGQSVQETLSRKNPSLKTGLLEWLKC